MHNVKYWLFFIACCSSVVTQAETIVVNTKAVVLVEQNKLLEGASILIEDKHIKKIAKKLTVPANAKVIDLTDSYVAPGLMDVHTHLCWHLYQKKPNNGYVLSIVREPTAYRAIQGVSNARDMLMSGFTTVRDVGNAANYADTALREAIEDGLVIGPTIYNAGRLISPFGGQRYVQPERPDFTQPEYYFADTKDELKKAIRHNIHYGAKLIKLIVDDQPYIYSEDDIRFVVQEAEQAGMRVAAHVATKQGAINAIKAKVASLEHGFSLTEKELRLAKKNGVALVSTTFPKEQLQLFYDKGDTNHAPAKIYQKMIAMLQTARKVGVEVPFGADVVIKMPNKNRGEATMDFIHSYLDAGYQDDEILYAMTYLTAKVIGIEHERGMLQQGFYADLIASKSNPLKDIKALHAIHFVMKEGQVYKQNNQQVSF